MSDTPFERDGHLDKPAIVGARWWQRGLAESAANPVNRRQAMSTAVVLGVALAGLGGILALVAASNDDDWKTEPKDALQMQRDYGWNFGSHSDPLVFDGVSYQAYDASAIDRMVDDLEPKNPAHRPFWSPTLFQAPTAMPTKSAPGDPVTGFQPLKAALKPISTPKTEEAFGRGKALARILERVRDEVVVVVDLPGPEAVAFAAGMSEAFDPVFLFENWPHPLGVVKAHLALASAVYFQPLFAKTAKARSKSAPPVLVLDRDRLAPYVDDGKQFDNRWIARLPSAAALQKLGAKRVLYVVPFDNTTSETDDLVDDFVAWDAAGLDVRMMSATALAKPAGGAEWFYGGEPDTDLGFWVDYAWWPDAQPPAKKAPVFGAAKTYRPKPRATPYSSGSTSPTASAAKPKPAGFGTVPVVVLAATGVIQGAKHSRSGSWNRTGSSGWGG